MVQFVKFTGHVSRITRFEGSCRNNQLTIGLGKDYVIRKSCASLFNIRSDNFNLFNYMKLSFFVFERTNIYYNK